MCGHPVQMKPDPVFWFLIPERLPGLNEMLDWSKRHVCVYSKNKKLWSCVCGGFARAARLPRPIPWPVRVRVTWIEPNRRRDADNVHAGIKFILDGLVGVGVLNDDARKWVANVEHRMSDTRGEGALVELLPVTC